MYLVSCLSVGKNTVKSYTCRAVRREREKEREKELIVDLKL